MTIHCDIVTQDHPLFSGEVDIVVAPGADGEMGILPHHAPLLTTLTFGVVRVRRGADEHAFAIAGGVMEVTPAAVTVLADVGEAVEEIDVARAEAARARAEEMLRTHQAVGAEEYLKLQAALRRSELRLNAARKYRKDRN